VQIVDAECLARSACRHGTGFPEGEDKVSVFRRSTAPTLPEPTVSAV
jgi:hypothetical protein